MPRECNFTLSDISCNSKDSLPMNSNQIILQETRDLHANHEFQDILEILKLISDTTAAIQPQVFEDQRPVIILRETWKDTTFVQPAP